jgi:hypothetical protein
MGTSKARRLAFKAAEQAVEHAGTRKGELAAQVSLAMAMLELAHQLRRLGEQIPRFGPPEER